MKFALSFLRTSLLWQNNVSVNCRLLLEYPVHVILYRFRSKGFQFRSLKRLCCYSSCLSWCNGSGESFLHLLTSVLSCPNVNVIMSFLDLCSVRCFCNSVLYVCSVVMPQLVSRGFLSLPLLWMWFQRNSRDGNSSNLTQIWFHLDLMMNWLDLEFRITATYWTSFQSELTFLILLLLLSWTCLDLKFVCDNIHFWSTVI